MKAAAFLAVLLAAPAPGGAVWASAACVAGEHSATTVQLFFGRDEPGGGLVSEADWQSFLKEVVTPAFPGGLSDWDADGQWRDPKGVIVKEPSKVLLVVLPGRPDDHTRLAHIVAAYKARFRQQSVLVVEQRECVAF